VSTHFAKMMKLVVLVSLVAACLAAPSVPSEDSLRLLDVELPIPEDAGSVMGEIFSTGKSQFIINGEDVDTPGKYPWQISLQQFGNHICGGSIIAKDLVLTAAHCINTQTWYLTVVVGLHDVQGTVGSPVVHSIASITKHESYNRGEGNYPNDIAVIRLQNAITFGPGVQPVDMDLDGVYGGPSSEHKRDCVITGWGYTSVGLRPQIADKLQVAKTGLLSKDQCTQFWGNNAINDGHVCIYDTVAATSACMGDSGGPLVCRESEDEAYKLVGLTSWGSSRCSVDIPGVYTRLSYFKDWIVRNA